MKVDKIKPYNMTYTNDSNLNDFLYVTAKFGERPSKIVLAFNFKPKEFLNYFQDSECVNVITEVSPAEGTSEVNEKYLIKLKDENIIVSYMHLDKNVETGYISNVVIYYKMPTVVTSLLEEIDEFIKEDTISNERVNIISNTSEGLGIEGLEIMEADYENMKYYYNNSTIKDINKTIKKIEKNDKGLFILYGKRGSGKTTILNYIASNNSKVSIFIPLSMIDYTINNPEFIKLLQIYNPLLIIDDCEILFDNVYAKSNTTYSNILQMVDGFYSDEIKTHVMLSFNTEFEEDIDEELLNANNLLKVIHVKPLNVDKASELSVFLKLKHEIKEKILLVDLLKGNISKKEIGIGYN